MGQLLGGNNMCVGRYAAGSGRSGSHLIIGAPCFTRRWTRERGLPPDRFSTADFFDPVIFV